MIKTFLRKTRSFDIDRVKGSSDGPRKTHQLSTTYVQDM